MKTLNNLLDNYTFSKIGDFISIKSYDFNFVYQVADTIVKEEFKGKYRYFGGLQCGFDEGTPDYIQLEKWLIEIAELILKFEIK